MPKLTPKDLDILRAKSVVIKTTISVGLSSCGIAAGAEAAFAALGEEVKARGLDISVRRVGCAGMCSMEPLVEVAVPGQPTVMYGSVTAEDARKIIAEHLVGGKIIKALQVQTVNELAVCAFGDNSKPAPAGGPKQYRIVMRNCGVIDPESFDEYVARDGYQAVKFALTDGSADAIIEQLRISGLRGRGGAGFPTHMKWDLTRKATGEERFIICNADEGDPGAYMDRSVLEGDPHAVLEGMILGGFTIGAKTGIFYIRAEYPLAIERVEKAIKQARANGLLGQNILGTTFCFDCEIRLGAGAFVCGEETALIASVEGKRGTPRPRPPFPSVKGLWDQPTMINNVETLANIAQIINRGGAWFAAIGIGRSTGTKVFAVTGKVKHSGLVEIPMGTTLREIVMDIGGGAAEGNVKAVQTGGPSGGMIPASLLDTPVTYEHLQQLGSIMGSGGMIVMDDRDSVVDLARFYLEFCVDESCGKCAPCRIGGTQMQRVLEKIVEGKGGEADVAVLRRIAQAMQKASLCALGQTAPNPVLSAMKYFPEEFAARMQKSTPAAAV